MYKRCFNASATDALKPYRELSIVLMSMKGSSKKNSYERRDCESIDEKSLLSQAMS